MLSLSVSSESPVDCVAWQKGERLSPSVLSGHFSDPVLPGTFPKADLWHMKNVPAVNGFNHH